MRVVFLLSFLVVSAVSYVVQRRCTQADRTVRRKRMNLLSAVGGYAQLSSFLSSLLLKNFSLLLIPLHNIGG